MYMIGQWSVSKDPGLSKAWEEENSRLCQEDQLKQQIQQQAMEKANT